MGICPLSVAVEGTDGSRAQAVVFGDGGNCFILGGPFVLLAEAGVTMSLRTFAASGGFGAKTYTLSAGNEGGYFSINATSGVLSVVMNAPAGVYTLSVQVSDSRDFSAEARIIAQVVVRPPLVLANTLIHWRWKVSALTLTRAVGCCRRWSVLHGAGVVAAVMMWVYRSMATVGGERAGGCGVLSKRCGIKDRC